MKPFLLPVALALHPVAALVEGAERRVTLGKDIGDRVVVRQGIAVGDEIVTRGVQSLTEGQIVGEALE